MKNALRFLVVALLLSSHFAYAQSTLALQEKCAEQAQKVFSDDGYAKNPTAAYSSHYNPDLDKCFMEVFNSMEVMNADAKSSPGTFWTFYSVFDAFEGKVYGACAWHTVKDKKYWEVSPVQCDVTLPSGEKRVCRSQDEFEKLIEVYMGGAQRQQRPK